MFENKHLIVAMASNVFTSLYVDMLINNVGIEARKLAFISLDDGDYSNIIDDYDVYCDYYKNHTIESLSKAKTLTFISLNKYNSFLVKALLDFSPALANKIYVHLTDDELDRWVLTKKEYGKIVVTKKNVVSDACIDVLPKLKHFIAADDAFRPLLESVLERVDFSIIDARDAFSVMPVALLTKFRELYKDNSKNTKAEKKLLIGAKRHVFSLSEVLSVLRSMEKKGILLDYKYMIFTYKKRKSFRILLDIYCLYLRHIKRKNIDISYPTVTNSITYQALIASCSDLILQRRGSMTTAREYIRMGRGVIHIKDGDINERELTQTIGVDVAKYTSFDQLAQNIEKNNIDVLANQVKMEAYYKRCYLLLEQLYN